MYSRYFPDAPCRLFFVGIGGIGMSALAQYLVTRGYIIGGSDRGLSDPAKAPLYDKLRRMGLSLYEQDGSGVKAFSPTAFVVSAAIELESNPDIQAAPSLPVIHRAFALSRAMASNGAKIIGVAGSCGKSSVTAWIASALHSLGHPFAMINGGYAVDFLDDTHPGNFYCNSLSPEYIVAEIDESDQSINEFSPDAGIVLNIGDDHYDRAELRKVFRNFLCRCGSIAITGASNSTLCQGLPPSKYTLFEECPKDYHPDPYGISFSLDQEKITIQCRQSGRHSACNGAAVYALIAALLHPMHSPCKLAASLAAFRGVLQRFEVMTLHGSLPAVIDDYAHNPEKIAAAIATARECFGAPLLAIFQPHGFTPLGFMREALKEHLKAVLTNDDSFLILPVYYAGGTAAFSPTSDEIATEYAAAALPVQSVKSRQEAEDTIFRSGRPFRAILILGARDASLRVWAKDIASALSLPQ